MFRIFAAGAVMTAVAGCAGDAPDRPAAPTAPPPPGASSTPPKPAGPPHKVVFADNTKISFHYDHLRTDVGKLEKLAQEHCDRYDRSAQPAGVQPDDSGLRQADFACVSGQQ